MPRSRSARKMFPNQPLRVARRPPARDSRARTVRWGYHTSLFIESGAVSVGAMMCLFELQSAFRGGMMAQSPGSRLTLLDAPPESASAAIGAPFQLVDAPPVSASAAIVAPSTWDVDAERAALGLTSSKYEMFLPLLMRNYPGLPENIRDPWAMAFAVGEVGVTISSPPRGTTSGHVVFPSTRAFMSVFTQRVWKRFANGRPTARD